MDNNRSPDTSPNHGQKQAETKRNVNSRRRYPEQGSPNDTSSTPSSEKAHLPATKPTYTLKCTLEDVMRCVRAHKSYEIFVLGRSSIIEDLPKFDDITRYNLEEKLEDQLWHLEAERLYAACQRLQEPLRFNVDHVKPTWEADRVGFQQLSDIADQLMCGVNICIHDNQLVLFDHETSLFDSDAYHRAKSSITRRYDPSAENAKTSSYLSSVSATELKGVHCALIDYITVVVARTAIQAIPTEFWHKRALAALAKLSAKLRYLVLDLQNNAHQALEDGQDLLARKEATETVSTSFNAGMEIVGMSSYSHINHQQRNSRAQALEAFLKKGENHEPLYLSDIGTTSDWAARTFRSIIDYLQTSKLPGHAIDVFDTSTIIYATSWNDFTTMVHQERDGEITGTSMRTAIRTTHEPFRLTHQFATEYKNRRHVREQQAPPCNEPIGVELDLEFHSNDAASLSSESSVSDSFQLKMTSLSDVVAGLVLLGCTGPSVINNFLRAMPIVTLLSSVLNSLDTNDLPPPSFTALVAMRTQAHEQTASKIAMLDFRPVSRSLLAPGYNTRLPRRRVSVEAGSSSSPHKSLGSRPRNRDTGLLDSRRGVPELKSHEVEKRVSSWLMEENQIIVRCRRFVAITLALCIILIVGGILVGILLGERLSGVDPFNITTFAWILAGFVMLLAKSIYVTQWPWKDFLQGRVPCRSVSELQMATGIDAQDILEYLLSREAYTTLITKGPFNRLFARRGTEGFSIDVKVELESLIASGIVVVKVAGRDGPALVCLDLRRGFLSESCTCITHFGEVDMAENSKGCFDFPDAFADENDVPVQLLSPAMNWVRIFGVYNCPKKRFR